MRRHYVTVIIALVLLNTLFLWLESQPKVIPQNQTCDQASCPWPATNEQLFQREQQKQYLDQHRQ